MFFKIGVAFHSANALENLDTLPLFIFCKGALFLKEVKSSKSQARSNLESLLYLVLND